MSDITVEVSAVILRMNLIFYNSLICLRDLSSDAMDPFFFYVSYTLTIKS